MAAKENSVLKVVRRYLDELRRHDIPVSKAFLFGSYAGGNPSAESDIDLAVISEAFTGDRFRDRRRIVPLRRLIDSRIEPIPFDPRSFARGGIMADEIKRTGIPISLA
ncbi:MAG: nucleotidyltransferase domain-containing protein [Candidatus Methylomirabilia bacterium]